MGSTNNPNKKYVNKNTYRSHTIRQQPPGPEKKTPPLPPAPLTAVEGVQRGDAEHARSSVAIAVCSLRVSRHRERREKKGDGACARLAAGREGHRLIGQPRRPTLGRVASVPGAIWPPVVWRESPHARLGPHARKGVGRGTGHRPEVQRQPERLHPKRGVVLELLLEIDVVFDAVQGEPAVERVVCHH